MIIREFTWQSAGETTGQRAFTNRFTNRCSDRGSEFADGDLIELSLEAQIYMADPHASWQRARNENLDGLQRQHSPRKRDFSTITQKEIHAAKDALNQRPRKRHGFLTPIEVFFHYNRVALQG